MARPVQPNQYVDLSGVPLCNLYNEFCHRFNCLIDSKTRQEAQVTALIATITSERQRLAQYQQWAQTYDTKTVDQQIMEAHLALEAEQASHRQLQTHFEQLQVKLDQGAIELDAINRKLQESEMMLAKRSEEWNFEHTRAEALRGKVDLLLLKSSKSEVSCRRGKSASPPPARSRRRAVNRRRCTISRDMPIPAIEPQELECSQRLDREGVAPQCLLNLTDGDDDDDDVVNDVIKVSVVDIAEN